MKPSTTFTLVAFILFAFSCTSFGDEQEDFLECLHEDFNNYSSFVYTPSNTSYTSILQFSAKNRRFATKSTPKPALIITPELESQIPPVIYCAKESGLQIRTRSGGHDAEGLSYVSQVPFVVLDLINLSEITVDVEEKTAWVGAGSTVGALYYRIAEKSPTLGFPAALGPTVGVGGHFSGGGYGFMLRKYGLAADHIVDARIVDVSGMILDRKTMGEDLFWAIRGGGGASFGVILAWKVELVDVPERVTTFSIQRNSELNATQLVHRWQYVAPTIDRDLYLLAHMTRVDSNLDGQNATIGASFYAIFLGGLDRLLVLMQEKFPELGLSREDCSEMSWVQATLFFENLGGPPIDSVEILLNRTQTNVPNFKIKSDYVQKPIPKEGLEGMWRSLYEPGGENGEILFIPYGGRMDDISSSSIPFPHRAGNMFKISSTSNWGDNEAYNSDRYIRWNRRFHRYMTPYVSKSPRRAYANYRDLDIGVNNVQGKTSYAQASVWGLSYFAHNFDRLVRVKTAVDPENFFRFEQSIPSLQSMWTKKGD